MTNKIKKEKLFICAERDWVYFDYDSFGNFSWKVTNRKQMNFVIDYNVIICE
jgi:hypothetical protein